MGTITERKGKNGKTYKVQIRRKGHGNQTESFRTKAMAERWMRLTEADLDAGRFVDQRLAKQTTLEEALERYEQEITPKKDSAEKEASFHRLWRSLPLAKRSLASLKTSDFKKLSDKWEAQGLEASTVVRRLALPSNLFTVARKLWGYSGLINPLSDLQKPKVSDARTRTLMDAPVSSDSHLEEDLEEDSEEDDENPIDRDDLPGELDYIEAASQSKWLKPAMNLAVETAMRLSEIASLEWEHINLKTKVAHLPKTKNGDARNVPLSPAAVAVLSGLKTPEGKKVFGIRADSLSKRFGFTRIRARKRYVLECQAKGETPHASFLVGLRFHDLRHEATTRLASIFQIHELAKITGHKSTAMLLRYYHPKAEDFAKRFPKGKVGRKPLPSGGM